MVPAAVSILHSSRSSYLTTWIVCFSPCVSS